MVIAKKKWIHHIFGAWGALGMFVVMYLQEGSISYVLNWSLVTLAGFLFGVFVPLTLIWLFSEWHYHRSYLYFSEEK